MSDAIGTGERLGAIALIRGAAALAARKLPVVLILWLMAAGLTALPSLQRAAAARANSDTMIPVTYGELLYTLASPVLVAWLGVVLLRAILDAPTGEVPRGGGWLFVVVIGGTGLAAGVFALLVQTSGISAFRMGVILSLFGLAVALIGPIFALWPMGLLMGGPARSPATAVRAMRGAYLGFVVAVFLIALPPKVLTNAITIVAIRAETSSTLEMILAVATINAGLKFVGFLLAAEVFRRRYLSARDAAAVFD